MRNNHGMTRADRRQRAMARTERYETHHYTDGAHRATVPLKSTEPAGSRKGQTPARRGWNRVGNTNLQLSRGGLSCFPRNSREIGYSPAITER